MDFHERQLDFCLLIPCYNNFEGLVLSINSVHYHIEKCVIIVVDDGSTMAVTDEVLRARIGTPYSIIIIRNEENKGIVISLNRGLAWIDEHTEAKYVARLDCGDTCEPDRFFKQVNYMEQYSETGLLGSWCKFRHKESGSGYNYKTPVAHEQLKKAMYFRNVFIHPTVIFRKSLLKKSGYYPLNFSFTEDYAFFWKLISLAPSAVLDQYLVVCEINEEGISLKNRRKQLANRIKVLTRFGTSPILRIIGILRIYALLLLPNRLALRLKKAINGQYQKLEQRL